MSKYNTNRIVVGLDIGTTKVAAVVGRYNEFGAVDILGVGTTPSEGVERGTIIVIDKTVEAVKRAILQAEKQSNVEIGVVTVGIAGEHIRSMPQIGIISLNNSETEIAQSDVDRLTREMYNIQVQPGNQILHVIPQEYAVDDHKNISDAVGIPGIRLEGSFHVVTASETAIRTINKVVERAGLEVDEIVLEALASSEACLQPDEKTEGVVLVDIGGGTTDVAIWLNGRIRHTATIPFGGNVITEDIRQGCQVMRKHAETIKCDYGSAAASQLVEDAVISISGLPNRPPRNIQRSTLARIIQARMEEIAEMVALEVRATGLEKMLVGGIVLTGGGSELEHACELFEYVTGIPTRKGLPTEHLAKGLVQEAAHPKLATATGLVVYALAKGETLDNANAQGRKQGRLRTTRTQREGNGLMGSIKSFFEKAIDGSPVE